MTRRLDARDLAAFAGRDWARVRRAKKDFWADSTRRGGPLAGLRAGAALWEHARSVDPTWPDASSRQADLEHHVHLCAKLRRLQHVFARR